MTATLVQQHIGLGGRVTVADGCYLLLVQHYYAGAQEPFPGPQTLA